MKANRIAGWFCASVLLVHATGGAAFAAANLSITKTKDDLFPAAPGDNIAYTITVTNNGPDAALDVTVTDLTLDLDYVSNSGNCTGGFPCNLGTLTNGQSVVINSIYNLPSDWSPPNPALNLAEVTSSTPDNDTDNNTAFVYADVAGQNCGNFAVTGGNIHSCAIVAGNGKAPPDNVDDDLIECWGNNFYGQADPPPGTFASVTAGALHTCGLRAVPGAIECWGYDGEEQVTDTPSGTDFIQVDAGSFVTCAVTSTNSVVCWGANFSGERNPPGDTLFVQVAGGLVGSCGLTTAGTIKCWGYDGDGLVSNVPTDNDFVQVVAGGEFACGRHADGTVDCWGYDYAGETDPPSGEFTSISAGSIHVCGLDEDGLPECWGDNDAEQSDPIVDSYTNIDAGDYHTCAILADGTIQCWGALDSGTFEDVPPQRSSLCPTCGDGEREGRESISCEPEIGEPGYGDPLPQCCSPILCAPFRLVEQHVCRDAGGSCDPAEVCDGSNVTCPAPSPPRPNGFVCRLATGSCDPPETCNGVATTCPADDPYRPSTFVCRTSAGSCDIAENCTGSDSTCPTDEIKSSSSVCRSSAGGCDIVENCTGTSATCPADTFVSASVTCRHSTGICDLVETCTGNSATCPNDFVQSGTTCRTAAGVCDMVEFCNGTDKACPNDVMQPDVVTCRSAVSLCDQAESCTGTAPACPNDGFKASTTPCRIAAGVCDVTENCTGASSVCPANTVKSTASPCRASTGVCDLQENCAGGINCPANSFRPTSTVCRGASGVCDVAENCTGVPACPADSVRSTATVCRGAGGVCDVAENCDGTNKTCPADVLVSSSVTCRGAAGVCDTHESCTGASVACPADTLKASTVPCRGSAGVCDVVENCTGGAVACPADVFSPTSNVCRGAVDGCDVSESCTGGGASCPANSFAATTTGCNDGSFCNGDDNCNGSGGCTIHAGDPCPGPNGDGNCAQSCNETADACIAPDPDGSPCSTGSACLSSETCLLGVCQDGEPLDCDDGNLCTTDSCDFIEGCQNEGEIIDPNLCYGAGKFSFSIKDTGDPTVSQMQWKWKNGDVVDPLDFGTPDDVTTYSLCVFDYVADTAQLIGSYTVPPNPLWILKTDQIKYSDKAGAADGITSLKAKASTIPAKSSFSLKAKGTGLTVPPHFLTDQFLAVDTQLVVQMRNSEDACWSTEFTQSHVSKNNEVSFNATGP